MSEREGGRKGARERERKRGRGEMRMRETYGKINECKREAIVANTLY